MTRTRQDQARPVVQSDSPRGLEVERFELEGDEFAVFAWELPRAEGLTEAEQHVLELLVGGATNAEIAHARAASVRTVANQVASVLRKLGASSRFDLIRRFAASHGRKTP
ncbi:MAG TPA: helix-turn-helix transcriptional regulator [Kofleriaceae bacterium]|nr:helix-turn-helix transcriptional regulator [Kofleriaceae bacterium]